MVRTKIVLKKHTNGNMTVRYKGNTHDGVDLLIYTLATISCRSRKSNVTNTMLANGVAKNLLDHLNEFAPEHNEQVEKSD